MNTVNLVFIVALLMEDAGSNIQKRPQCLVRRSNFSFNVTDYPAKISPELPGAALARFVCLA